MIGMPFILPGNRIAEKKIPARSPGIFTLYQLMEPS